MNVLGDLEAAVVRPARHVVARLRPPTVSRSGGGPLLTGSAARVLDFVGRVPLEQPARMACGPSTLTMLRMLRNPDYAAAVIDAADPAAVFGKAALAVWHRTNSAWRPDRRSQLPWPSALGTRPAAMIGLLDHDPAYGSGGRHRNVMIDPDDPGPAYDAIVEVVTGGEPLVLFIGDQHWMQHIVLVVGATAETLTIYDPFVGTLVEVSRSDFVASSFDVAGWAQAWLVLLPR